MARVKKGLSYVLGDNNLGENHILPINAMQFSLALGSLFTAGRDGVIKLWNSRQQTPASALELSSNEPLDPHTAADLDLQDIPDTNEKLLKLETRISSSPLEYPTPSSRYNLLNSKNYYVHFDWVNDLKLVNNNRHLVSASADLSLKIIDLERSEDNVQKFQNLHTDYIKKLSSIPREKCIISGGLDGTVVIWDLTCLKPVSLFSNESARSTLPRSIYALANDHCNLISTGGPNNTINLFDRRILPELNSNLIRKLVGHQDNVRCLLMNSTTILSGSSDTTIKLWDMRNFSVYKNVECHDDAVWSLCTKASSDPGYQGESTCVPDFKEFYSGDKAGNIVKTDLRYLSSFSENDQLHHYRGHTFSSSDAAFVDERIGICTLLAKTDSPVISLCVENDSSIFASTYDSLKRFHVPNTSSLAEFQYLQNCVDIAETIERKNEDSMSVTINGTLADKSDLNSDFYDIVSHLSMETPAMELQSTLSGNAADHEKDLVSNIQHSSMFLSINGGPSSEFVNAYKDISPKLADASGENSLVDETPIEILLYPIPSSQIVSIPFNKAAFQLFQVYPKSIIAKRMFNNKRQVLTLYSNGDIKIWDIFICKDFEILLSNNATRLPESGVKERTEYMDNYFENHQTVEILSNWCDVDIKSGKLFVTLNETSYSNVEIYYDELIKYYPNIRSVCSLNAKVGEDDRFWLARIFLNSILYGYCLYEWRADEQLRETIKATKCKQKMANNETDGEKENIRKRFFSRKSSKINVPQAKVTPESSVYEAETASQASVETPNSVPENSITKMLYFNEKFYQEKYSVVGPKKNVESLLKPYNCFRDENDAEYRPIITESMFPKHLLVIIYESSPDLGNYRDLFSFHLEEIFGLEDFSVGKNYLVDQLRLTLPKWIGALVLYNKFSAKELPKITFQLLEVKYEELPAHIKIGKKSQKKIKKLPMLESSIKLTSHSMLRVSKILQYLTEKFDTRTSEMKAKIPPSEWLVLSCKGKQLDTTMTLQTIKTMIWKSSSDIELRFCRKFDEGS